MFHLFEIIGVKGVVIVGIVITELNDKSSTSVELEVGLYFH